jgi:hypothetical protein
MLTDVARFELLDPICQGLNALKGNANEAQHLRETNEFVSERVKLAARSAQVVMLPKPHAARIRMLEIQIMVLQQELAALKTGDQK